MLHIRFFGNLGLPTGNGKVPALFVKTEREALTDKKLARNIDSSKSKHCCDLLGFNGIEDV